MVVYTVAIKYDPESADTDITNHFQSLEIVDTGTGEIKSAKIVLNALDGKFLTSTPVLAQFDKIRITLTDDASNTYDEIFEVDRIIPVKNAQEGLVAEIEMLGQEHYLQKIDVAKQFFFTSAYDTVKDIGDFYNDINGSAQPELEDHDNTTDNGLPRWTANTYEFGVSEIKAYDAMLEVVNGLGASVAAGGSADFWELYFKTKTADPTKIQFRAFSSGSLPTAGNEITITDSLAVNEAPMEGGIDALTGSLVKAWGKKGIGTLPQSVQDFSGQLLAFQLDKTHPGDGSISFPSGARVQLAGTHYTSDINNNTSVPPTNWTSITFDTVQGAANGYSEWTEGKADEWKSSGSAPSNPASGNFDKLGCYDSNMVIEDGTKFMTWVHAKATVPTSIPDEWKYAAGNTAYYRGLRCLVNGTGTGDFNGNDKFGVDFDNNVAVYNGTEWIVHRVMANDERCAIRQEGKVYELQTGTWTDISASDRRNHCFHIVNTITNVAGYNSTSDGTTTYGAGSAVEWRYTYTALSSLPAGWFTTAGYYQIGAWANWSVPFPENSYNSNTLGELYGANSTKKEPATIDVNNMHLTRSAKVGFNNSEAEDFGILQGIQFWAKVQWKDAGGNLAKQGNFIMRCFMYDNQDNIVIQDFTIPFNDLWKQVSLPFSKFEPYRARAPIEGPVAGPLLFTKDLEILNIFQWKNIKMIGVQWQDSYDNEGRYYPYLFSKPLTGIAAGTGEVRLAIDAFCFTKPLLKVTAPDTTRPIEHPAMQFPDVSNSVQLQQIVNSQLEIEQFQHKEFTITTGGKIDINFGDTFFLTDSNMVNDADTRTADSGGTANTIRLVAKRIVYRITKPSGTGGGQFLRTITGIKRFVT